MRSFFAATVALVVVCFPASAADNDKWSTVKGKVVFDDSKHKIPVRGAPKVPTGVEVPACAAKDKDFLTDEWIVDPKSKGVKDAVVWLAPEPTADEWKRLRATDSTRLRIFPSFKPEQVHPDLKLPKEKSVEMDQPCCRFIPHLVTIRIGQTLVIKNSAEFSHNAKYETDNNGADNPLIPAGQKIQIPFKVPEPKPVKVICSIHPWMSAWIRAFDHPYFATTNETGDYEIAKAPVGKFRVFIWHPEGGSSGGNAGRFGYELVISPKATEVKPYSVTLDERTK